MEAIVSVQADARERGAAPDRDGVEVQDDGGGTADGPSGAEAGLGTGVRLLLPFARHGRGRYVGSALLAVAGTLCQLVPFWASYEALRQVVVGTADRDSLFRVALVALAGVVGMGTLLGASTWMSHRAAFATLEQLRLRIGDRLGEVPLGFLTRRRSGAVQRVLNDDIERLEQFLAHAIPDLVSAAGVVVLTTIWLFLVDWRMALAAVAVLVIALPLMSVGVRRGSAKMDGYQRSLARMNASVVEFVRGLPVVRTFNRSEDLFAETSAAIRDSARFQAAWGREFLPLFTAFYTLLVSNVVIIVPVGVWLYTSGVITIADLLFFFVVGLGYTAPVIKLMELTTQLGHLGLSAGLVLELDRATPLPEQAEPVQLGRPGIELEDVTFSHRGMDGRVVPALRGVSLRAESGSITAVVGPSGSGKSTLAKLVCRFWDVDSGTVRVCGVDVRDMPSAQLMDQIAFVLQETFLFDDTVAANLRMGRPNATDAEVVQAARRAGAHEFVAALPQGYDTRIGERGARLSGGEQQRLSIARALLKDAPVVVLDEATAFVDPENEAALQDALTELVRGRTLLVVAHRLSTIVGADQILVMDDGQVIERGRHQELLAANGLYDRMWRAFVNVEGRTHEVTA
jgi:ATP-binding cassette, subfamily B, bacterial IrtA/YbtP